MKAAIPLIVGALVSLPAQATLGKANGLSGEIGLNVGYSVSKSSFNTDGNSTISSNQRKPSRKTKNLVFPLGSLAYTFGARSDKQVFLGASREDIAVGDLALEVGFKQAFPGGSVASFSYLPTLLPKRTWQDPFLENQARQKTDEEGSAYRFQLNRILGSGFGIDVAYATRDVDTERSGFSQSLTTDELKLLERDSDIFYLKSQYQFNFGRLGRLAPSITYMSSDADGKANAYDLWEGGLSLFAILHRHRVVITTSYSNRSYDASHPIYNKTREDDEARVFVAYEYQDLAGLKNVSFVFLNGYSRTDSNIPFYDATQYLVTTGINYKF